jgi:hypothetical protein
MKQLGSIPEPNVDLRNISLQCNLAKPTIKKRKQIRDLVMENAKK